ncbi:MAG: hypothetical protein KF851_11580 [Pirellulaceae bacterium]|nr:hypothetical protein [Pirellulaceae bacterium]
MANIPPSLPPSASETYQKIIKYCRRILSEARPIAEFYEDLVQIREAIKRLPTLEKGRDAFWLRIDNAARFLEAEEAVAAQYEIRLLLNSLESQIEDSTRSKRGDKKNDNDRDRPGSTMAMNRGDFVRRFCFELIGFPQFSETPGPDVEESSTSVVY